jgi:hypothetical protein
MKDKENLTEITLIFVNIFDFLPFPSPLLKPLNPEVNLQSIQRQSIFDKRTASREGVRSSDSRVTEVSGLLRSETVMLGEWLH